MKFNIFTVNLLLLIALFACSEKEEKLNLSSPDGKANLKLNIINRALQYQLDWEGETLVEPSVLRLFDNEDIKILASTIQEKNSSWKTVWGQFSEIQDHYKELEIDFESNGHKGKLLARLYNDGLAFRFLLAKGEKQGEANLFLEYRLNVQCDLYTPNGEKEPLGPVKTTQLIREHKGKKTNKVKLPVIAETPKQHYIAILESDLYSAKAFSVLNLQVENAILTARNKAGLNNERWITPWRVILFGKSAGDLVVSTTPVNLATPNQIADTDWIKPGKTLWDWRVHGYTTEDGFTYGINTESYKRFIDFAAEYNIDYFLIDDAWYKKVSKGHFDLSDKLDLQAVVDYAKEKAVNLMLYYDRRHGEYGDEALFPYYASLNMKGIKYGFMRDNMPFTRSAIELSAKSKLLIDFHDGPAPLTGIRRTLPNAVTREYCHAQQDSRRAFTPESFIKMALINAVTGTLDMNNGNFDITGINAGERQKGPRKKNTYLSTVVSEAARTLIIFSGLVCIPDAPEAYKAKVDLFEFIQKMPVGRWDESKILHSKMGEYISTARRAGKEWYIGSVISQKGGSLDISLDFLKEGEAYEAIIYEDKPETHCRTNPEAYQIRRVEVKKDNVIKAIMAPGGGHCMWIRPVK